LDGKISNLRKRSRVDLCGNPEEFASGDLDSFPIAMPATPGPGGAPKRVLGLLLLVSCLQREGILSAVQGNVNAFSSSNHRQRGLLEKRWIGRSLPNITPLKRSLRAKGSPLIPPSASAAEAVGGLADRPEGAAEQREGSPRASRQERPARELRSERPPGLRGPCCGGAHWGLRPLRHRRNPSRRALRGRGPNGATGDGRG